MVVGAGGPPPPLPPAAGGPGDGDGSILRPTEQSLLRQRRESSEETAPVRELHAGGDGHVGCIRSKHGDGGVFTAGLTGGI